MEVEKKRLKFKDEGSLHMHVLKKDKERAKSNFT